MISLCCLAITYLFSETVDNKAEEISWKYTEEAHGVVIESITPKRSTRIECTKELEFLSMHTVTPLSTLDIKKNANQLMTTSTSEQKTNSENYPLNGKPWIQQLWFGLIPFAKSADKELLFYIVDPASLKLVKLIAKKMGPDPLKIKDVDYQAQKILLTLPGLKGKFWKAHIWFDTTTHRFLKYVGSRGPGTGVSTVLALGETT